MQSLLNEGRRKHDFVNSENIRVWLEQSKIH